MRTILTASKDTTIYQAYPTNNAGLDEILEIGKVVDTSEIEPSFISASARSLIHFNLPSVDAVSATANYYLNLRLANVKDVIRNQQILVYPISRSWDEGSGYFYQDVQNVNDGATWEQASTSVSWSSAGGDFISNTASASISLTSYPIEDLRIDVTNILRPIVSQSLQNTFYGLALQYPLADENSSTNEGNVKVFSTQTHTIHQPTLEIAWDNQTFSTGSLKSIPGLEIKISPTNIPDVYSKGDISRISLVVRDRYPGRSFDSTLRYKNKYYLPSSSYYSIVDVQSNTTIIPFDNFSKIDCDPSGSYIVLDTSPLYKGRFYGLKLKVTSGVYTKTIDTDIQFQVL